MAEEAAAHFLMWTSPSPTPMEPQALTRCLKILELSHLKKVHPHSDLAFVLLFRLSTLSLPYPPVLLSLYVGLFLSL